MHLEQAVDVLHVDARTLRDALLARGVHQLGVAALLLRHRRDHGELALEDGVVEVHALKLLLDLAHARHHAHQAGHAAHLLHLPDLVGKVVEVELALAQPVGHLLRLVGVDGLGGLLDQRDDVAHAENARSDALGVEVLQPVKLFAGAEQLDRLARHGAHGQGRAASAIAVDAGEHEAGDADLVVEGTGEVDCVLTGQRIGHQQRLYWLGDVADGLHLGHQLLVDEETAGSVEHDHVVTALAGFRHGAFRDGAGLFALYDGQRVNADLLAKNGELLLRGGAAHVERGHQDLLLVALLEPLRDLGGGGGLARALQADHQHRHRRGGLEVERSRVLAQHLDQRVVDDLDDHLARRHRLDDLAADRLFLDVLDERADHLEGHVGLDQRAAHLAHGGIDVSLRKRAAPGQLVEYATEAVL